ncbi:acyl-CoA N-acyltransferase [Microdochium trichocladiopsis]|uniref:Acyl-CoA N-acyltransferase n=1 Tax=Microdochium trichocladiopsis TaxID=1682393 RepID=A0A9P8Y8F0_9PEZI|nr:acyl-CoA N-acyltransferase [Microdochium trichocladiopsis]KAH7030600.1 acyl-CoA N-acyltransferase [Microdochium trichocladiopsis]
MPATQNAAAAAASPASTTATTSTSTPQPAKPAVVYRDARYGELPAVAHVYALAFWDDHIFGHLIHPKRDQFPLDSDLYWLRRARVNYWDYRYKWLVAVVPDEKAAGGEKVVGVAQWERIGDGGKALECAWWDPRNLLKPASALAMSVHEKIWPNRAADPDKEYVIESAMPFLHDVWVGERGESWYLAFLGVDPDYQGKGIGKVLTRWGLDRAEKDGVVASVISALGKNGFYYRCGFDEQHRRATDGEGNPLGHTEGSDILWKWPSKR